MNNGGADGRGRCEEFREEAGEQLVKVGWAHGKNGKGTIDEGSGCTQRGG